MKFEFSQKSTKYHYRNLNANLCSFAAVAKTRKKKKKKTKPNQTKQTTKVTENQAGSSVNSVIYENQLPGTSVNNVQLPRKYS